LVLDDARHDRGVKSNGQGTDLSTLWGPGNRPWHLNDVLRPEHQIQRSLEGCAGIQLPLKDDSRIALDGVQSPWPTALDHTNAQWQHLCAASIRPDPACHTDCNNDGQSHRALPPGPRFTPIPNPSTKFSQTDPRQCGNTGHQQAST
jgi:hypothetical protein